jgi:hypothetical protein
MIITLVFEKNTNFKWFLRPEVEQDVMDFAHLPLVFVGGLRLKYDYMHFLRMQGNIS